MMLGIYIVAFFTILTLAAAVLFWRRRFCPRRKSLFGTIALVLILAGFSLGLSRGLTIDHDTAYRHWPSVDGTVVNSRIVGEMAFHPEITYHYEVAGHRFTGMTDMNTPGFGGKRKRFDVAEKYLQLYPVGAAIMVHYNPENPGQSLIRVGPTLEILMQLAFGVTLFLAGLFMVVGLFRPRINR